jgi:AcrR family transcriptional regulator
VVPYERLSPALRRERLLDAALQLAAGRDLSVLSVRDIARHAGVSEGLLYHYFPTKDALLEAAIQRAADALTEALDRVAQGPPSAALAAGLEALLDHIERDPTGWRAILQASTGSVAEIGASVEEHSRRLTLKLLDIETASPLLQAALDGWAALERECCLAWLSSDDISRAALEDVLFRTFFAAVEAVAEHDAQAGAVLSRLRSGQGYAPEGEAQVPCGSASRRSSPIVSASWQVRSTPSGSTT